MNEKIEAAQGMPAVGQVWRHREGGPLTLVSVTADWVFGTLSTGYTVRYRRADLLEHFVFDASGDRFSAEALTAAKAHPSGHLLGVQPKCDVRAAADAPPKPRGIAVDIDHARGWVELMQGHAFRVGEDVTIEDLRYRVAETTPRGIRIEPAPSGIVDQRDAHAPVVEALREPQVGDVWRNWCGTGDVWRTAVGALTFTPILPPTPTAHVTADLPRVGSAWTHESGEVAVVTGVTYVDGRLTIASIRKGGSEGHEHSVADFMEEHEAPTPFVPCSVAYDAPRVSHSADRCARCGGPVLLQDCARPGGCRTAEERIGEPAIVRSAIVNGEREWYAMSYETAPYFEHPTREGAIALWREAALAKERER